MATTGAVAMFQSEAGEFDAQTASIQVTKPYSRPQTAKLLGVHWSTVADMIKDGRLPVVQIGKRKKVLGAEILKMLAVLSPPQPAGGTVARRKQTTAELLGRLRARRGANRRRPPGDTAGTHPQGKKPGRPTPAGSGQRTTEDSR